MEITKQCKKDYTPDAVYIETFSYNKDIDKAVDDKLDGVSDAVANQILDEVLASGSLEINVPIDQAYNATSENAQSGKAVAEAIGVTQTQIGVNQTHQYITVWDGISDLSSSINDH